MSQSTCNAISGWKWLNGACWSIAIADSVSWNKGVGNDTSNTGTYTCNSAGTLQSRMEVVVDGRWPEICISIATHTFTSSDNGDAGKPYISAIAIADCVDGERNIGEVIAGNTWETRSSTLYNWVRQAGHSVLPAARYDSSGNEYQTACTEAGGAWYQNTSILFPGINTCWLASCGDVSGNSWEMDARIPSNSNCTAPYWRATGIIEDYDTFRVVVRS